MGDLERLGESSEFRSLLLDLLAIDGWSVTVQCVLSETRAGELEVVARKDHLVVRKTGRSTADVACDLFEEAMYLSGRRSARRAAA